MKNENHWCAVWGNAASVAEHHPESYARNITLRYPIDIPFGGEAVRLRLDNWCGSEKVHIDAVTVAIADPSANPYDALSCPVQAETITDITFGGNKDVVIPAGDRVRSDAIPLAIPGGCTVCVSLYLSDFTLMDSSVLVTGPLSKGYFSLGDQSHAGKLPSDRSKVTNWFYFLTDVELLTAPENHAIVCYGDSITAQNWPDELKLRLRELGCRHTSVIRRAVSGTRVLREYRCIAYEAYGRMGEKRFPREIPTAGADAVIIQQGINDIIHPVGVEVNEFRPLSDLPTAEELITGLQRYAQQASEMGIACYFGTLLPIRGWRTDAPFREDLRQAVNRWIRSLGDACIDFDLALRDSKEPAKYAPGFDSGDHLHPSAKAARVMAQTVPIKLMK